jgi:hypothetical protein
MPTNTCELEMSMYKGFPRIFRMLADGGELAYGGGPGSHYVAQARRLEIAHKHGGHMGLIITLIVFVGLAAVIVWIADWTSGV